jgi:putative oxidoreductase
MPKLLYHLDKFSKEGNMKTKFFKMLQIGYGLFLLIAGLNRFFEFAPIPTKTGFAHEFLEVLHQSGYIFPLVALIMMTAGILLLVNRYKLFALLILLPVTFNILAFHLWHDREGIFIAWPLFALNCVLLGRNSIQLKQLFTSRGPNALQNS